MGMKLPARLRKKLGIKTGRPSKYGNRAAVVDGQLLMSGREARRYSELLVLEANGVIVGLESQVRIPLHSPRGGRCAVYVADFTYMDATTFELVVEDAKGFRTAYYKLKKRFFEDEYYPLKIKET